MNEITSVGTIFKRLPSFVVRPVKPIAEPSSNKPEGQGKQNRPGLSTNGGAFNSNLNALAAQLEREASGATSLPKPRLTEREFLLLLEKARQRVI